jgi:hypothetical protein
MMSQENQPRRLGRSIGALLAGFVVVVVLSLGTDVVMHVTGIFPSWGQPMNDGLFLLATVYRTVFGVVGSYITARLAPYRPMAHSLVGAVVGMIIATVGAIATWSKGPEFGPHWYPVSLIVIGLPTAWAGARIFELQQSKAIG